LLLENVLFDAFTDTHITNTATDTNSAVEAGPKLALPKFRMLYVLL